MSRAKKRKVTIKLIGRNPKDSRRLLEDIEEVFRPKELEIEVRPQDSSEKNLSDESVIQHVADEQLEQQITEEAKELLDNREKAIKAKRKKKKKSKTKQPSPQPSSAKVMVPKRKRIAQWLKNAVASGYHITVKAIAEAVMGK